MMTNNEELIDYVIERDFEDVAAREILLAVKHTRLIGKMKLTHLLRGKKPYLFRRPNDEVITKTHWGRLHQFEQDQVLDMIESLIRLGMIGTTPVRLGHTLFITGRGKDALEHSSAIPMMIPWPLPVMDFPNPKPFSGTRNVFTSNCDPGYKEGC